MPRLYLYLLSVSLISVTAHAQSSTSSSTFPYTSQLYDVIGDTNFPTAFRQTTTSSGTHTTARIGSTFTTIADGSGTAQGPSRADYSVAISSIKSGYDNADPAAGENDGLLVSVRADNGDSNAIALNGITVNHGTGEPSAYMALIEGNAYALNRTGQNTSQEYTDRIDIQTPIVNPRNGDFAGYWTSRTVGHGGTGLSVASADGSSWENGLMIMKGTQKQLIQRTEDAALLLYSGTGSNEFALVNTGLALQMNGNVAVTGTLSNGAWTSFTPHVTPTTGSFGANVTAIGRYHVIGQTCTIQIEFDVVDNGMAGGHLVLSDLPASCQGPSSHYYVISGRENGSSGKMLQGLVAGTQIVVFDYANNYPVSSGAQVIISGSFEVQ